MPLDGDCFVYAGERGNDQACRVTSHFAASLTFISNLSDRGKGRDRVVLCLELLPRAGVAPLSGVRPPRGCAGDQEKAARSRKCALPLTPCEVCAPRRLHAGCWKQTESGSARCHGNLQRSSLSLGFSSTVGD
ncbi:unnamed protein product [Pleuronectes platessa]|uniref:Uncharacterized protein n=1 Tax=Pleuronectes platessa TaxID=8262 RepID=A0A9N7YDK9_PLEPL|nr:unnamed protein product [Pleuronectes platessa]